MSRYAVICTAYIVVDLSPEDLADDRRLADAVIAANGNPCVGIGGPFRLQELGPSTGRSVPPPGAWPVEAI